MNPAGTPPDRTTPDGVASPDDSPTTRWLDATEQRAWRSLIVLWRIGLLDIERGLRRFGLNHLEYGILAVLTEAPDGEMTAGELAELAGLSTSHLSHRLKCLESSGFIERRRDASDRRTVRVAISEAGTAAVIAAAPSHVADVRALLFDHLSDEETETLAAALGRAADLLSSSPFLAGTESIGA